MAAAEAVALNERGSHLRRIHAILAGPHEAFGRIGSAAGVFFKVPKPGRVPIEIVERRWGVGTDDPATLNNFYWDATWFGHFKKDTGGRADAPECLMRTGQYRMNPPKVAAALVQRNSFSSRHPSGANFVMADGSTRFVSTTIDHTESVFNGQVLPP